MRTRLCTVFAIAVVAAAGAAQASSAAQAFLAAEEGTSGHLLNAARTVRGLGPLVRQSELDAMARAQAARMAARGEIYHNPNLAADADRAGLPWTRVGENVGVGPAVSVIHDAFLASPRHRDNMLYPQFNAIGVGVAPGTGNKSGLLFVAHVFGELRSAAPRLPALARPSSRPAPPVTAAPPRPVPAVRPAAAKAPAPIASAAPNAVVGGVVDRTEVVGASALA